MVYSIQLLSDNVVLCNILKQQLYPFNYLHENNSAAHKSKYSCHAEDQLLQAHHLSRTAAPWGRLQTKFVHQLMST